MKFLISMCLMIGSLLVFSSSYADDCKLKFTIQNTTSSNLEGVVIRRVPDTCLMSEVGNLPPGTMAVPTGFSYVFWGWFGCSCHGRYFLNVNSINQRVWDQTIDRDGEVVITFTQGGVIWQFTPS